MPAVVPQKKHLLASNWRSSAVANEPASAKPWSISSSSTPVNCQSSTKVHVWIEVFLASRTECKAMLTKTYYTKPFLALVEKQVAKLSQGLCDRSIALCATVTLWFIPILATWSAVQLMGMTRASRCISIWGKPTKDIMEIALSLEFDFCLSLNGMFVEFDSFYIFLKWDSSIIVQSSFKEYVWNFSNQRREDSAGPRV